MAGNSDENYYDNDNHNDSNNDNDNEDDNGNDNDKKYNRDGLVTVLTVSCWPHIEM